MGFEGKLLLIYASILTLLLGEEGGEEKFIVPGGHMFSLKSEDLLSDIGDK